MKKIKFVLSMAAMGAFTALPVLAQHGAHGSSSSSMHGNNANAKASKTSSSSVSDKLTDNTKLSSKLQSLLPAGTNPQQAAQGFKNLGQFVAAVHVSNNLDIPWDQFRAKMVGPPSESLGKTIQALKPTANSKAETKKAQKQAKQDINDSKSS
jgi:hypothetical protein